MLDNKAIEVIDNMKLNRDIRQVTLELLQSGKWGYKGMIRMKNSMTGLILICILFNRVKPLYFMKMSL